MLVSNLQAGSDERREQIDTDHVSKIPEEAAVWPTAKTEANESAAPLWTDVTRYPASDQRKLSRPVAVVGVKGLKSILTLFDSALVALVHACPACCLVHAVMSHQ
ncbi:hypothetical protein EYF80_019477 [Liparis tanakae]|uniref:Uncharacterized protein n=1 Tax=Liparis tanakae TaxID=230148 RepID=A0A4Z2HZ56_9TELE|nr:hypothetical protein EYF80_019477 [Liparis tanakae]